MSKDNKVEPLDHDTKILIIAALQLCADDEWRRTSSDHLATKALQVANEVQAGKIARIA